MAKKYNLGKVSKRQQALNNKRGLKDLWIDGSFFDQTGHAGGAAVLCSAEGKVEKIFSFGLNHLPIQNSLQVELWTLAYALSVFKPDSIGRISTDCPAVQGAINDVRNKGLMSTRYDLGLVQKVGRVVEAQPNMALNKVTRGVGKIPLCDQFAKLAAKVPADAIMQETPERFQDIHTHYPDEVSAV